MLKVHKLKYMENGLIALLIVLTVGVPSKSFGIEEGGYVCREEEGAVNETWNFLKHSSEIFASPGHDGNNLADAQS